MLISVHIPKTGGASFRSVLMRHFGESLLFDYEDHPMARGALSRRWQAVRAMPGSARRLAGYACVHGHFLPLKYRWVQPAQRAIWLRDPVDRLASRYYHFKRDVANGVHDTPQFRRYIKTTDLSLEDFARIPLFHNSYAKFLWGSDLDQFDFVGITEDYARSMRLFSTLLAVEVDQIPADNTNPQRDLSQGYALPDRLRAYLQRVNAIDVRLYEQACVRNRLLCQRVLGVQDVR
ncbi:sulfotransferase family 2 domain-containing protein [Rhabdochromatium marinum]|uniref:sulfotransferase family 2 domain-containing protein n=1 Tax=Rhabdochromatium marinum TaxID=48729 RepID=UPI001906FC6C|nr:sulfotransferase family 2 domain-containing protein [Rhabdochromatium marinum]MBK1647494.1 hypothetical protein [Rhabdochromatium marinum]